MTQSSLKHQFISVLFFILVSLQSMAFAQENDTIQCQTIILPEGWFMFSSYISPVQTNLYDLLYSLISDGSMILVKDENGADILPEWGWNGIGYFSNFKGYQIKMSVEDSLEICGDKIDIVDLQVQILSGWSFLSYLHDYEEEVDVFFEDVSTSILIVKDFSGGVYLPEYNYNGIGNLEPGNGYQIKMNSSQTLIYSN